MKKLFLLLFLIPNLVMAGMGQKQMSEPVEGNLFEILGDALNKDKDSKKKQSLVSAFIPPTHNLISTEERNINGKKFHINIGNFIFDNKKVEFEELIQILPDNSYKIIYNEQKINGNLIQELSIFDEDNIYDNIYVMKRYYRDTFLSWKSYFCQMNADKTCGEVFLTVNYDKNGDKENIITHHNQIIESEQNYYIHKLNTNLINTKNLALSSNAHNLKNTTNDDNPSNRYPMIDVKNRSWVFLGMGAGDNIYYDENSINQNEDQSVSVITYSNFVGSQTNPNIKIVDIYGHKAPSIIYELSYYCSSDTANLIRVNAYKQKDLVEPLSDMLQANINGSFREGQKKKGSFVRKEGGGPLYDAAKKFCSIAMTKNKKLTPTQAPTTSTKVSIDDAKAQCSDIGFKAGTEKFGECVMELMK